MLWKEVFIVEITLLLTSVTMPFYFCSNASLQDVITSVYSEKECSFLPDNIRVNWNSNFFCYNSGAEWVLPQRVWIGSGV